MPARSAPDQALDAVTVGSRPQPRSRRTQDPGEAASRAARLVPEPETKTTSRADRSTPARFEGLRETCGKRRQRYRSIEMRLCHASRVSAETIAPTRARSLAARRALRACCRCGCAARRDPPPSPTRRPCVSSGRSPGIPCPLCGGTTAAVNLGHGDLAGGVASVAARRRWSCPRTDAVRHRTAPVVALARLRRTTIAAVFIAAEIWQLARFGIIHVSSIH